MSDTTATEGSTGEPRSLVASSGVALAVAFGLVAVVAITVLSGGNWGAAPQDRVATADKLALVRGQGGRNGALWIVQGPDASGSAVLATRPDPFAAASFGEIEWQVDAAEPGAPTLIAIWQTREEPRRTFAKPVQQVRPGLVRVRVDADDGWSGTIVGFGLATRGAFAGPLAVHGARVRAASVANAWSDIVEPWTRLVGFSGNTITFPFDEERFDRVPVLVATACAVALACLLAVLRARKRGAAFPSARIAAVFVLAWLVLDVRWQATLLRELVHSAAAFAGKTDEEKHRAAADAELYALVMDLARVLPAAPARILFLSDNPPLRARASYFLLPRNVYHDMDAGAKAPPPDTLRSGDHVVMFLYRGLAFDPARGALVWPDGRTRAVETVKPAEGDGPAVYRVP